MFKMCSKRLVAGVAALAIAGLSGCAGWQPLPDEAAAPAPVESKPATAPAPVAAPAPAPAAAPAATHALVGKWIGKWVVDGTGTDGKAEIEVKEVNGDVVVGVSSIFDTPFGDLISPFSPGKLKDASTVLLNHENGAIFTLKLSEAGAKPSLKGTFKFEAYTGTLNYVKQ
jgi:3-oxoacyl-ACP reductase-like protein